MRLMMGHQTGRTRLMMGHQFEGRLNPPFSLSGFNNPPVLKQENDSIPEDEAEGLEKSLLQNVIMRDQSGPGK
jgi:hypothetical protein